MALTTCHALITLSSFPQPFTFPLMLLDRFKSASAFMASTRNLSLPTPTKLAVSFRISVLELAACIMTEPSSLLRHPWIQLYADYKIATEGRCKQSRPYQFEFEKYAKWKAWKEAEDRYVKELEATQSVSGDDLSDNLQPALSEKAMIAYVQRVEEGQWGWTFDPTSLESFTATTSTGDRDLDELEAYLGVDQDEISAEELLARPYVPVLGEVEATLTASGISTLSTPIGSVNCLFAR